MERKKVLVAVFEIDTLIYSMISGINRFPISMSYFFLGNSPFSRKSSFEWETFHDHYSTLRKCFQFQFSKNDLQ